MLITDYLPAQTLLLGEEKRDRMNMDDSDAYGQPPTKLPTLRMTPTDVYFDVHSNQTIGGPSPEKTNSSGYMSPTTQNVLRTGKLLNERPMDCGGGNFDLTNSDDNSIDVHLHHSSGLSSSSGMSLVPAEKISRTNLYIKGLPDSFNDEKLWNLAPEIDQIKSVKAATDDDGKCRGYGFIDFVSNQAAKDALNHIRDTYPAFTIKFAKENEKDKTNLYVTNLPKSWTTKDSDQLKLLFERFGAIQSAFVMVERPTNRSTGVGFVRFLNEMCATKALESLKKDSIVLPECTSPVDAKFADKHNPDTRRRRYPMNSSYMENSNTIGYPQLNNHNGALPQDSVTALLNANMSNYNNPHTGHGRNSTTNYRYECVRRLAQHLFTNQFSCKLSPPLNSNNNIGLSELSSNQGNADLQLNALAAVAASTLMAAPNPAGLLNNCFHSNPVCGTGGLNANLNGSMVSTNPLSLLGTTPIAPTEANLIDPSGLYHCPVYGQDLYRLPQHQQQLLAAAIASINAHGQPTSIYPSIPDMASYLGYSNLLNPVQQPNTLTVNTVSHNPSCMPTNGSSLASVYATPSNGLIGSNTLLNSPSIPLSVDSMGLINSRPNSSLHQWIIPAQLYKNGNADPLPMAQAAILTHQGTNHQHTTNVIN